ncbi:LOG family protein [Nocardioides yefusunii]|uniref:LOG family protein n=1 Tax=Nocardioides yefusunii TaxID=2500546 RepID=A0ABW1QV62_9ACTN|nr:LOG family protein [Nocardioides yefusunii]
MRQTRGQQPDVHTRSDFEDRIRSGARSLAGWRVLGADLTRCDAQFDAVDPSGALFVGCVLTPEQVRRVRSRGAIVFPTVPGVPVRLDRDSLYSVDELYDTERYRDSLDARAYAWSHAAAVATAGGLTGLDGEGDGELPRNLHDHAVDAALERWRSNHSLVGVMGGHAAGRGTKAYAGGARLGHALGQEHTVATGGGPGAMEAANVGGRMADHSLDDLDEALTMLAAAPSFTPDVDGWVGAARDVLTRFSPTRETLGVPTWHYGHEPPNAFATAIAKYFRNATREAILLEICDAGIVFLPGAGGTVQEIFQDACENYYADESSVAPMVLLGKKYWTETLPAWPLLKALARGRVMEKHVHLVDSVEEAAEIVGRPRT